MNESYIVREGQRGGVRDGLSQCGCLNVYIGPTFVQNIPTRDANEFQTKIVPALTVSQEPGDARNNHQKLAKKMHDPERKR